MDDRWKELSGYRMQEAKDTLTESMSRRTFERKQLKKVNGESVGENGCEMRNAPHSVELLPSTYSANYI